MTSKEALEKVKLKFSTSQYLMIENEFKILKQDLELLDWLIEKMYVAPELLELKVCPKHNEAKSILKYHNGIETRDDRFWNFIDRIHELKYKRK